MQAALIKNHITKFCTQFIPSGDDIRIMAFELTSQALRVHVVHPGNVRHIEGKVQDGHARLNGLPILLFRLGRLSIARTHVLVQALVTYFPQRLCHSGYCHFPPLLQAARSVAQNTSG